jgi:hypothetical protein
VLRIKHLVFADGLTLAGVRRRIEEEAPPVLEAADAEPLKALLGRNAKERLTELKRGLQAIMEMLSSGPRESHQNLLGRTEGRGSRQFVQVAAVGKRKNGARSSKPTPKKSQKRRR